MATNTAASFTNHTGNGTAGPFSISFSYLSEAEVDVTVGGVLKTITTHYTFTSATQITFTSGNEPGNGVVIKFQRDTNVGSKKVDFVDGSVLTESDLDTQNDQLLFAVQEITDNFVKKDGSQVVTGDLVFEGSVDDTNETTLAITNPTADRTITLPDTTGTVVTTGDTGTVTSTMIADGTITAGDLASNSVTTAKITDSNVTTAKVADDAITSAKIADGAITSAHIAADTVVAADIAANAITASELADDAVDTAAIANSAVTNAKLGTDAVNGSKIADDSIDSEHYVDGSIDTAHIADSQITTGKLADNSVTTGKITDANITTAKIADDAVTASKLGTVNLADLTNVHDATPSNGQVLKYITANNRWEPAEDSTGTGGSALTDGDKGDITVSSTGAVFTIDNDAVTQAKIAANAVGASELADNAVDEAAIANDAVTRDKINSVSTSSLPSFEAKGDGSSQDGYIQLNCSQNSHGVKIKSPPHSANASYTLTLPNNDGDAGQFLKTDGSGVLSFDTVSSDLVVDTSPQLGGNLDINGNDISGTGNISTNGNISGNAFTTNNGGLILNATAPTVNFVDSDANPDYEIKVNGGIFDIRDSTSNASRIAIDANGKVGIGTSTPSELLQIYDASGNPTINLRANNQNTASLKLENDDGDWTISSGTSSYPLNFAVGGSNKLTILNDGKVGIGDTTPSTELEVNGTVTATSFAGNGSALTGIASANRNLIINGAMQVAQRGTSSTTQSGYGTVDRMSVYQASTGATITSSQVDVASGTPAYQSGFRKAIQITKGAGTAATNSQINLNYQIEAQDIANSGWDYTNSNSYLTFSFWVKTSVANHNPQVAFVDMDSSQSGSKNYQFEVPTLTANTWTKITHSIPGHADQVYDNNNAVGIHFYIYPWLGTDFTDNSNTMNAWSSFGVKDINTTWLTTNGSTFQVTGMQLEVGSVATGFEHRSFGQELALCQRYFFNVTGNNNFRTALSGFANSTTSLRVGVPFPTPMRATPTFSGSATAMVFDSSDDSASFNCSGFSIGGASSNSSPHYTAIEVSTSSMTAGQGGLLEFRADNGKLNFSAEL